MSTSDRELLELAARACGPAIEWDIHKEVFRCVDGPFLGAEWSPISDDGDRYRLAQKLGLVIDFEEGCVWRRLHDNKLIQEFWGGDTGVSKGRALLLVAAEIGRRMP